MAKQTGKGGMRLFIATFVSAFLFILGAGTIGMMVVPVLANRATVTPYQPQLPVSTEAEFKPVDPDSVPAVKPFPPLEITEAWEGNFIRIPSIKVAVPLKESATMADQDVIASLQYGAALYPNGVAPGHLGNVFIAAHSTGEPWKGKYRFAFVRINELKAGNTINLDWQGTRYTYRVVRSDIVKPSAEYRVVSDRPVPTVTLMACWPLWSTSQRMLVTAELTNITLLTPTPK